MFDRVNHDRLIYLLSGHVTDKPILRLIEMILRSGVMVNGVVQLTEEGTVQGGLCKESNISFFVAKFFLPLPKKVLAFSWEDHL